MVKIMDFDDYCREHGLPTTPPQADTSERQAHMSDISKAAGAQRLQRELQEWNDLRRDALWEYTAAVERGEIVHPSRLERLLDSARGHEDNLATQAARKLLALMQVEWEEKDYSGCDWNSSSWGPVR